MDTDIMRRLERILEDARAVNAVLGDWDKIIADARKAMDLMRAAKVDLDAANELLAGVATLIAGVSVPAPVVPPTPPRRTYAYRSASHNSSTCCRCPAPSTPSSRYASTSSPRATAYLVRRV